MPRILIVDDDDAYRSVIKEHLASQYEIIDTPFPEDALVMAVEQEPAAVLMDLSMPGLSGFELCQTLSSLSFTQRIPIFIITGQDERNKIFCQNLGAAGYFTKPVDFTRLKAELASAVGSTKIQRRRDLRVQVRLPLMLRGKKKDGSDFETRVTTENMSSSGFLCACSSSLDEITSVEVCLCGEREHRLGDARLVRIAVPDALHPDSRYGFQFTGFWSSSLVSASA
jgi:DNA-binding response OmpR family regulator